MVDVIGLLSSDGYVMCNKRIIKLFGTDCAVLLGELCSEYKYHEARGDLINDSFFATHELLEENTGLNAYSQRKAFETLKSAGILKIVKMGMPAKNYFQISYDMLCNIFTTCRLNFERQDVQILNVNNNKDNNNKSNNKNNNARAKHDYSEDFETVWKAYPRCVDKGRAFKCFEARLKEGYKAEDILKAVRVYADECRKNHTDEKYIKHLSTFIGPDKSFEDYLNASNEVSGFDPDNPFAGYE